MLPKLNCYLEQHFVAWQKTGVSVLALHNTLQKFAACQKVFLLCLPFVSPLIFATHMTPWIHTSFDALTQFLTQRQHSVYAAFCVISIEFFCTCC
jgi:hypothetical protein